jgi:hypothetical protein
MFWLGFPGQNGKESMYKEPYVSKETNDAAALRVEEKMEQVATKVADPDQSDTDFTANLLDLCTLNRMAESHAALESEKARLPPVRSKPLAPALQRVWDDLACMCREGGYASINVASITRRNAIIAVDEILRAGARLDGQKEAE